MHSLIIKELQVSEARTGADVALTRWFAQAGKSLQDKDFERPRLAAPGRTSDPLAGFAQDAAKPLGVQPLSTPANSNTTARLKGIEIHIGAGKRDVSINSNTTARLKGIEILIIASHLPTT